MNANLRPAWCARLSFAAAMLFSVVSPSQAHVITLCPAVGPPTTSLTVRGKLFPPNTPVTVSFDQRSGCVITSNRQGAFSCAFPVPKDAQPGQHTVTAAGGTHRTQKSYLVRSDWYQQGLWGSHSSYNPYENTINVSNIAQLKVRWSVPAAGDAQAVADGLVYTASGNRVGAYRESDGTLAWQKTLDDNVQSPLAARYGKVYVFANKLYALDSRTGVETWSKSLDGPITGGLAVAENMVFLGTVAPDP